jgi:hypothetical protein
MNIFDQQSTDRTHCISPSRIFIPFFSSLCPSAPSPPPSVPALQGTTVTGVRTAIVTSPADVFPLLQRAKQNRSVARTKCNERSSRSHSVFQV